jgi:hypothetical protein
MMNKYDMVEIILRENLIGGKKMDPSDILLDLVAVLDDSIAERGLRSVARNWGITLNTERDRSDD